MAKWPAFGQDSQIQVGNFSEKKINKWREQQNPNYYMSMGRGTAKVTEDIRESLV